MRLNIKKEQRFRNSGEVKKLLRDEGIGYTICNTDEGQVIYADVSTDQHIKIREGTVGPATNIYLVRALSMAGIILLLGMCLASWYVMGFMQ